MKSKSLKLAIVLPSLAVLIIGIAILTVTAGTISANSADDLTGRLMDARVSEFANEFRVFSEEAYGVLRAVTPIVAYHSESALTEGEEDVRNEVVAILSNVLLANDKLVGAWTVWEPNAFDGRDSDFVNTPFHDETGRFVPYVFREGASFGVEALVGYDDPVEGDFYMGARNSGRAHATDPYVYLVGGREIHIFSLAIPILVDGAVVGAVGVDIGLDDITMVMNAGTILDDGYLFTLSPNGYITTHPNSEILMTHYSETWMSNYGAQVESLLSNGGTFAMTAYSDIAGSYIAFLGRGVSIGDTGRYWLVVGIVPQETVDAASQTLLWTIIAIGAALIAAVGVTIYIIIRRSLKKLPVLTAVAEEISLGGVVSDGLDHGAGSTKNEITLLERAFVKMTDGIREQSEVMSKIADGDYSVSINTRSDKDVINQAIGKMLDNTNSTLNQISVSASEVSTGSKQVAEGAQSLAQGSTEQAASIEDLSRTISEIAEKTKENADIAEKTSKLSVSIRDNAEKGSHQMDDMITAVTEINEASRNISKIIKTIDDIAFQTNILALNAAVEAARAGQHGKGFAVVAEEVRNLASKSAAAAKDTGDMIQNSMEKAELGSRIAGETATSLGDIVEGIKESTRLVAEIAKASEEQSKGIFHINTGIDQVGQVISQNSATAQESAASSEEMSGQADMLQSLIAQFKLRDSGGFNSSFPDVQKPAQKLFLPEPPKNTLHGSSGKY